MCQSHTRRESDTQFQPGGGDNDYSQEGHSCLTKKKEEGAKKDP